MGWFSPIKGSYPSLSQIDMTLPVKTGNTAIERGMLLKLSSEGNNAAFEIAPSGTDAGLLYISLQDYKDAQAGMAGTTGFDATVGSSIDVPESMRPTAGVPSITGLSLSMEGEYETSIFDPGSLTGAPIGAPLSLRTGRFVWAGDSSDSGDNSPVIAYLTAKPYERWVNNETAKSQGTQVVRQGKNVSVIRFRTK